jgi:predicted O-methyltransferase YrrM
MDFIERLRRDAFFECSEIPTDCVLDTHGWCDEKNFIETFDKALSNVENPLIVEVGTWKGRSACAMASHVKKRGMGGRIVCIDTWLGAPEFWTWGIDDPSRGGSLNKRRGYPTVYDTFLSNVKLLGHDDVIAPFPLSSIQAAKTLDYYGIRPDVVYVDAAHEEDAVKADLDAFFPLLKNGGTMFGDDYVAWPGVRRAVNAFVKERRGVSLDVAGEVWALN